MKKFSLARFLIPTLLFAMWGCGGNAAPDFKVESFSQPGTTVSLAELKGKVVLLEFWATWCGPCRQTMPVIEEIYTKYKDKGLEVVSVTSEPRDVVEGFMKDNPHSYPIYLDTNQAANEAYRVDAIPYAVIIDKNGSRIWDGHPGDKAAVEKVLKGVL